MLKLSFYGGAQEVTGACYLLETESTRILIDCGLFQCARFCEKRNRDDFPFKPETLHALIVTHGHIDHIGRVPKLVGKGFRGRIISTPPTRDFGGIMLEDSLRVLEKEARNDKEEALYTEEDIAKAVSLWEGIEYHKEFSVGDFSITLRNSGHVLGSAMIEIKVKGRNEKIVFTGDLGNSPTPLLPDKDAVEGVTHLIIESAYGDRVHEDKSERKTKLERVIENTFREKGVLMIPAFSVERTQELLFEMNELVEHGRIPSAAIFIDSPLAIKVTRIYAAHHDYFNEEARRLIQAGDDLFRFPGLKFTESAEESKGINNVPPPKVIVAGAGMMQGGRILHHAKRYLPGAHNTLLFIGYQGAGSLGRRLLDGADEVTIHGEKISVAAHIQAIGGYSAHADANALYDFISSNDQTLKKVFVVQGEPSSSLYLVQRVRDNLGINAAAPANAESFTFEN